jgi:uncharacterized protein (TIGR00369 family)
MLGGGRPAALALTTFDAMPNLTLPDITALNQTASFNRWAGFEVVKAENGQAVLTMPWHKDGGQYAGHLHAGLVSALLDTVCGFAAVTVAGPVVTSQMSVSFTAPAAGKSFAAEGTIVKSGRRQVFAEAKLYAIGSGTRTLTATATAVLVPIETKG